MEGFKATDRVADHYDAKPAFAGVLNRVIPGFEFPEWSHLTLAEALGQLAPKDREDAENALNGWGEKNIALTARQAQFVAEHSGEQRSAALREAVSKVGANALALMQVGDEQGARKLMLKTGLSDRGIDLLFAGWRHEMLEHELDEEPAVCCVVNAVAFKTYVGRIVRIADDAVWQEVEPGQIVEHDRAKLGELPPEMADVFYRHTAQGLDEDEIPSPWLNSWAITYAGGDKAVIKTAALVLINANSIKPNPFRGRIVSETERRFVQENEGDMYSGHLKAMTGELEIGQAYEIRYRGKIGQQVAEVEVIDIDVVKESFVESAAPVPASAPAAFDLNAAVIGAEIFKKLDVVVVPQDITECIGRQRCNASFSGIVIDVDLERGLVVQSLGRRQATVHRLEDFEKVPVVGMNIDIKYRDGTLTVTKEQGRNQGLGR